MEGEIPWEKNKSSIIIIYILLVIAIAVGGYYFMQSHNTSEADSISADAIETCEIGSVDIATINYVDAEEYFNDPGDGIEADVTKEIKKLVAMLNESEAECFYVDEKGVIYQTDKDTIEGTFKEKSSISYNKSIEIASNKVCNILSMKPKQEEEGYLDGYNNDSNCNMGLLVPISQKELGMYFGSGDPSTDVKNYFDEHELKVQGSDVCVNKIVFFVPTENCPEKILFLTTGKLQTISATGDLSDIGIYPSPGETKDIGIIYMIETNDQIKNPFIEKRLPGLSGKTNWYVSHILFETE